MTILTKKQYSKFVKDIIFHDEPCVMTVCVRYDDQCGNGHNSFSITGEIISQKGAFIYGGCIHDKVAMHFPELSHLLKWHFTSSDGPMHYIANTTYHAKNGNLGFARNSAVWPDATLEQLMSEEALKERLPELMVAFKETVESIGFTY